MDVIIDGTRYTPADQASTPRFGLGITTRNRHGALAKALAHWREHTPEDVPIVIVDDASDKPVDGADHRFDDQAGVAAAKNKCLELLHARGVTDYFLADDDLWPIADRWWEPYLASPEPHLMMIFADLAGPKKLRDIAKVYDDGQHVAYTGPRGPLLYANQAVLDTVGGMDAATFGRWGYEHGDWSNRIHAAGLTTWRYADVACSGELFYSLDQHEQVERTVPTGERARLAKRNAELHHSRRDAGYAGYVEYRQPIDAVITAMLTSQVDPQRGARLKPDPKALATWAGSITGARPIVLADELAAPPAGAQLQRVPASTMSPYHARWLHLYQHLRTHPEYRWVFATDGTDVRFLRPPWGEMQTGRLYIGYEPQVLGCSWMRANHRAQVITEFIDADPGRTLLNAGVVGGDRATVLQFAHHMVRMYFDNSAQRFWHQENQELGFDMGSANLVAYTHFGDRIETGPRVVTLFKHGQDASASPAWIAHK